MQWLYRSFITRIMRSACGTINGMTDPKAVQFDVLIIGSGAAGLSLALRMPAGVRTALVAKRELQEGNTLYAQGGISAVLDGSDSVDSHVADTLEAGAGLCDAEVVRLVVEHGPENIRWLYEEGVEFTRSPSTGDSGYHLTREGGHSHRRSRRRDWWYTGRPCSRLRWRARQTSPQR
jgi:L-aspartate oxidase